MFNEARSSCRSPEKQIKEETRQITLQQSTNKTRGIRMSISNISEPDFIPCNKCKCRMKKRVFKKSGRGKETIYYCTLLTVPRQLYGQKGCTSGKWRTEEE